MGNKEVVKKKINVQEKKDYIYYKKFIDKVRPGKYTIAKTKYGTEYDVLQIDNNTGERYLIEIKYRDKYAFDDFDTFMLSLHKTDSMQIMMKKEKAQKGFIAGLYPKGNKVVLFDITDLTPTVADIKWVKVKKTEFDDNSERVYQPKAMLNMQPGKYKHYSTYVYDFNFED